MIKQVLLKTFEKSTYGKNERDGRRVLNNDLIADIKYEADDNEIFINSLVISESLYSQYNCRLDMDKKSKEIISTKCSCSDYEKNGKKRITYCCKHLVATFYRFLDDIEQDTSVQQELGIGETSKEVIKSTTDSVLDLLIGEKKRKREIKIEVLINRVNWYGKIAAEFRIGLKGTNSNKLYILKDIGSFLISLYNKVPLSYGKDFTFDINEQKLSNSDKRLIKLINLIRDIDRKFISGKQVIIPDYLVREFFNVVKNNRVYLGSGFYSRLIEIDVLEDKIDLPMFLEDGGKVIKLEAENGIPESLTSAKDVYLYNSNIYLPPEEQIEALSPYIESFSHGKTIFFAKEEEERILRDLIPSMQGISKNIRLSKSLREKIIISPVSFKFYFDKEDETYLILKVCYGQYEFNIEHSFEEKIIYRDKVKENEVVQKLKELGFEKIDDKFMFFKSEDDLFRFFSRDIAELQGIGEVYYSENFTGIKSIGSGAFKGEIRKGKFDYFELKFTLGNIQDREIVNILRAFRDNKKYYRLENGEFLDLNDLELNKVLALLDSMELIENENKAIFNKNKAGLIEDCINDLGIKGIRGRKVIKEIKNYLASYRDKEYVIPNNINATLREYQVEGYKWLKTLDYLGFGGILGDEMGLGKTLQTITFITSNKDKRSLIVAPTSLIYNWKDEFRRFSPDIKVAIVNGGIKEREELIKNYKDYDVLITTYNLLRRDMSFYENKEFDYCILDEAQNIKNSSSQNAVATKSINAKRKFALTGTPMENSLMELWSIFDFIMPGYLFDEKRFLTRYHRRLEEDKVIIDEVNKLIRPFILRRFKSDVIKELPEKIEKKLIVPLDDEQKKVYGTYANYVQELIDKKVKNDEFTKSKIEILSYITKLRQICLDPGIVMENYTGGSSKLNALKETVTECIEQGHKILVFSQFTTVLKNVKNIFDNNCISYKYLDGSTPSKERAKLVDEFNNDDTEVFLISLKAGGTGLNLTSADIVIHLDPWWNPAVEDQATDRAHRIGQNNIVEVIKIVAQDTIEEKIISLQEEKKALIDKIVGKEAELDNTIMKISDEEIISLFY